MPLSLCVLTYGTIFRWDLVKCRMGGVSRRRETCPMTGHSRSKETGFPSPEYSSIQYSEKYSTPLLR